MYLLQRLLLEELSKTHACNPLLIAEADEDVKWATDQSQVVKRKRQDTFGG